MTGFLIGVAALMLATLLLVLPPLMRTASASGQRRDDLNLAVLRQQSQELDAEHAAGLLGAAEYAQARRELERRVTEEVQPAATMAKQAGSRWAGIGIGMALPLLAALMYLVLGSPASLVTPSEDTHMGAVGNAEVEAMVAGLAKRMQAQPDNADGWRMLARSYNVLGRHAQAAEAFSRTVQLTPDDASLLADFADTLAMAQNRSLQGEPERLVQRALALEPTNLKALSLAGSAAYERGDFAAAEQHWRKILPLVEADSEIGRNTAAGIAQAQRQQAGPAVPAGR